MRPCLRVLPPRVGVGPRLPWVSGPDALGPTRARPPTKPARRPRGALITIPELRRPESSGLGKSTGLRRRATACNRQPVSPRRTRPPNQLNGLLVRALFIPCLETARQETPLLASTW